MTISQSIAIKASPAKVYEALISAEQFGEITGAPAEISSDEGGAFSCFGGQITGRHIELIPDERIVQAWRVKAWPEGVFSEVRFDLSASGDATTLELTQTGYPDDAAEHLEPGWHKMYWEPLKAYLEG
jgi:activator of HSP90 ATPase